MVSNKRCIPGCRQSSATKFGVPQNMRKIWETKIGIKLNRFSKVCANHFNPSDIISTWTSGESCNRYSIFLKKPRLKEGAIPFIFTTYVMMRMRHYTYSENQKTNKINRMKNKILKLTTA